MSDSHFNPRFSPIAGHWRMLVRNVAASTCAASAGITPAGGPRGRGAARPRRRGLDVEGSRLALPRPGGRCCTGSTSGGPTRSTPACRALPLLAARCPRRCRGARVRAAWRAVRWLEVRPLPQAPERVGGREHATLWIVVLNWNGREDTRALLADAGALPRARRLALTRLVVDNGSSDGGLDALRGASFPRSSCWRCRREPALRRRQQPRARARAGRGRRRGDAAQQRHRGRARTSSSAAARRGRADPAAARLAPLILSWRPARASGTRAATGRRGWAGAGAAGSARLARRRRGARRARARADRLPDRVLPARDARVPRERSGPLDERYFIYAEDADWCLRARRAGFGCLFVPRAVCATGSRARAARRARGRSTSACAAACAWRRAAGGRGTRWLAVGAGGAAAGAEPGVARARRGRCRVPRAPGAAWADHWRGVPPERSPFVPAAGGGMSAIDGGHATGSRSPRPGAHGRAVFLREVMAELPRRRARARRRLRPGLVALRRAPDLRSPASTSSCRPGRRARGGRGATVLRADLGRAAVARRRRSTSWSRHYVLEHVTALEACCDELARVSRRAALLYVSVPRSARVRRPLYRFAGYFAKYALIKFGKRIEHQQRFDCARCSRCSTRRGFVLDGPRVRAGRLLVDERPAHEAAAGAFTDVLGAINRALGARPVRRRELRLPLPATSGTVGLRRVTHVCRHCGEQCVLTPPEPPPATWTCPFCGQVNGLFVTPGERAAARGPRAPR